MTDVFVLGSGFSKALNACMPVTRELGAAMREASVLGNAHPGAVFYDDPETLLSYLIDESPWKDAAAIHGDRALFVQASRFIGDFIRDKQAEAGGAFPPWAEPLVKHWHENRSSVVSFNHDTLVEQLYADHVTPLSKHGSTLAEHLYQAPLTHIAARTGLGIYGAGEFETLHLLKMHGSLNWLYSGHEKDYGGSVYYLNVPAQKDTRGVANTEAQRKSNADLVPLIVPPVSQKAPFYDKHIVSLQWKQMNKVWREASRAFFIGYSLPPSDLTVRAMLQTVGLRADLEVFVVNSTSNPDDCAARYEEVFGPQRVKRDFMGPDSIERLTAFLTTETEKEHEPQAMA